MDCTRRNFMKIGGLSVTAYGLTSTLLTDPSAHAASQVQDLTKDVEPLTRQDFLARQQKARQFMNEFKIDGLFLTGSVNLKYFTNTDWGRSERTFGAVLNLARDPIWVCPAFEEGRARERIEFGDDVRTWEEHESPFMLIGGIMRDLGAAGGTLAVGPTVRSFVFHNIKKEGPALTIVDGSPVTENCRGIKTAKEQKYMDVANRITKLAYVYAFDNLFEGMSQQDFRTLTTEGHEKYGAVGGAGCQFGPNSAFPHGSSVVRYLKEGGILLADGGCSVEGFRSDVSRTVVLGKPSDKQRRVWDLTLEAQDAAFAAIRPGVACEDVDRAARTVIEDGGFGPDYKYFTHRVGHGIGMEGHEYSWLTRGNKLKLQPGMCFSNEPGVYIVGEFGTRIEDCFVVTEDGYHCFGGMRSTAIDKPCG